MGNKTVVLDNNDLDAIVRDASPVPQVKAETPVEAPAEVPAPEEKAPEPPKEDPDDIEGEDGLTPRQKRDLTQKMQVAIGKKHRALKDAEEFAAAQYAERRLAEQRAEAASKELERLRQQQVKAPEPPKEPKREDFETEQAYQDARVDYRAEKKFQEKETERLKALEAEKQAEIMEAAKERITRARELVPDFAEVVEGVDLEVPPHIAGYMQESEMFAEIGYHFAKHPEELGRLQKLPPARALVELGKIESKLSPFSAGDGTPAEKEKGNGTIPPSSEPSTKAQTPAKPRPPITPLSSASAGQVEKSPAERSYAEELAHWQKVHKVNLGRRQRH